MWASEDASWSLLPMLRMEPQTASIPIVLCTGAVPERLGADRAIPSVET
jgi:hypothetical protein